MDFWRLQIKTKANALSHTFQCNLRVKNKERGKNKNQNPTKQKRNLVSVISPKYLDADEQLEGAEGVISFLYTAASTVENTMFSVSYLTHKMCLMLLVLCIKKMKIPSSCFSITHLVIVLQLHNYLEELSNMA